ncbi:MAG: type II CRISPR RNA-guided endonuclease Cas9 [Elusimicrobiota bacterium]
MENKTVFAFDIGTGSLGTCVRKEKEILDLSVNLLPQDFATLKEAREKRRQIRTRIAHKMREKWWKEQAKRAGIEIPETGHLDEKGNFIKPDERMSREFPKDGDNTIYNSALLRIALLQGKKLEGWQIFKAIWSAIQHRGYDSNLPWINNPKRNVEEESEESKDEKENKEAVKKYNNELKKVFGEGVENEKFYYPCYYEAYKMGIWSKEEPENLNKRISNNPSPARNKDGKVDLVIPRELIEKEIKDMLIKAGDKYPYIKENLDYILYGPAKSKYAAYRLKEYKKYRGKDWEWQGLLSQKTPRFDNRLISKCVLIPRLNVCKAKDELNKEVTFLMKLKNMRYFEIKGGEEKKFNAEQIKQIFEKFKDKLKITEKQWSKYLKDNFNAIPNPAQLKIDSPKIGGRSSFCRPALRIIKELILSGKKPSELYKDLTESDKNTDPKKGLIKEDYNFLLKLPDDYNFYISDSRDEESKLNESERKNKIDEIISEIINPVVKHRLKLFYDKLIELKQKHGMPEKIIIEFVRDPKEGFYGEKRRKEIIIEQNKKRKENDLAFEDAKKIGLKGKDAVLKVKLHKEQGGFDIYDGNPIKDNEIDNYEIDHIVPRESGGPDSYINKVLTSRKNNEEKGKRTPYEWLKDKNYWNDYVKRIKDSKTLSDKKKTLLTSSEAVSLAEKYTQLAETAYIAKLSQKIAHLFFGWPQGTLGSQKKVIVANGSLTAKMRGLYGLNRVLHSGISEEEYRELVKSGKIDEKNRDNPRHHALDAIVLSMIPEIQMNDRKKDFFPIWFTPDYCRENLEKCFPKHIKYEKPKLAETIYGLRKVLDNGKEKYVFVMRFGKGTKIEEYYDMDLAKKNLDSILSDKIKKDFSEKLSENPSAEEWKKFIDDYNAGGKVKKIILKCSSLIEPEEIKDFLDGKVRNYGEFIKGKMPGQYLKQKKDSYGYMIYKNEEGKWVRESIYAFDSVIKKQKEIKEKYKEAYYFRSGMLVEIQNDFEVEIKKEKVKIKKGNYYLTTVGNNNFGKIEKIDSSEVYNINIKYLIENGKMKPVF